MVKKKGRPKLDMPTQQKSLRIPQDCVKLAEKYNISITKVAIEGIRNEVELKKLELFLNNPRMVRYRKRVQEYMKNVREKDPDFDERSNDAEMLIDAYMVALNKSDQEEIMAVKYEMRRHPAIYDTINEFEQFIEQHPDRFEEIIKTETDNLLIIQKILEEKKKLKKEVP